MTLVSINGLVRGDAKPEEEPIACLVVRKVSGLLVFSSGCVQIGLNTKMFPNNTSQRILNDDILVNPSRVSRGTSHTSVGEAQYCLS